ncbi:hypothetical protein L914_10341 [Phytophthora nicotianae]|uniref:Uncharacterized protein n=1 Tax=Phytophthora nicotianae TaxID=4792 RepID=W2N763_PHYNI|nr:hypothetical protein L914_10341 [Phytophthora nicotianae]
MGSLQYLATCIRDVRRLQQRLHQREAQLQCCQSGSVSDDVREGLRWSQVSPVMDTEGLTDIWYRISALCLTSTNKPCIRGEDSLRAEVFSLVLWYDTDQPSAVDFVLHFTWFQISFHLGEFHGVRRFFAVSRCEFSIEHPHVRMLIKGITVSTHSDTVRYPYRFRGVPIDHSRDQALWGLMCLAFVRLEIVAIWGGSLKLFALRAQDIVIVDSSGTAHSASSTSSDRMGESDRPRNISKWCS